MGTDRNALEMRLTQCCGSGMFIPDPMFPSRIQGQKDSGSRILIHIKEIKYRVFLTQNFFFKLSEIKAGMFIPDPDLDFLPIPDSGFKKAPDPGGIQIRNTDTERRCTLSYCRVPAGECGFQLRIKNKKSETCIRKMTFKFRYSIYSTNLHLSRSRLTVLKGTVQTDFHFKQMKTLNPTYILKQGLKNLPTVQVPLPQLEVTINGTSLTCRKWYARRVRLLVGTRYCRSRYRQVLSWPLWPGRALIRTERFGSRSGSYLFCIKNNLYNFCKFILQRGPTLHWLHIAFQKLKKCFKSCA